MPKLPEFLARLARRPGSMRRPRPPVSPYSWLRRHWRLTAVPVTVALVLGLLSWHPWRQCGEGLSEVGSPHVCVGLDLNSTALQSNDPFADLEGTIANLNARTGDPFKTIVLLENLTPREATDSVTNAFVKHSIQGAITAIWPDKTPSRIKLLLANYGSNAASWQQTVDTIISAKESQHIIAVTGLGQSLTSTRDAAAKLSKNGIATIGSVATADDMNKDTNNNRIEYFYRVGPTNTDEAQVAVNYITPPDRDITTSLYKRIMLVRDTNERDIYANTLAEAFQKQSKIKPMFTKKYKSPDSRLTGTTRDEYLQKLFGTMHIDICNGQPDLIYFAGRGIDLRSFVASLATAGACQQLPAVTVLTGDDASNVDSALPPSPDIGVHILYTALAYPDQWPRTDTDCREYQKKYPGFNCEAYQRNYQDFVSKFIGKHGYDKNDLRDGVAIMERDAAFTAVKAANEDPGTDSASYPNWLSAIDCSKAAPGASGFIAFNQNGNQINKAMPILEMQSNDREKLIDLVWAQGRPLDTSPSCSS